MTEDCIVIPLSPMRKTIAARMTEATQTIPHYRLAVDIEMDALMALHQELRSQRPEVPLSLNDLIIKASAAALTDVPAVNIQWVDRTIRQFRVADVSVVMAVEGGITTPVIRSAQDKSVWKIAREIRELAGRAAGKMLRTEEVLGGTFSISNLGMYGVDRFDAIINAPQCAILAVGTAKQRVVVSAQQEIGIAHVLTATLSCDHRAIDGAVGATFLAALRERVERPGHINASASNEAS